MLVTVEGKAAEDFAACVLRRRAALVRLGWVLTGDRQWGEDLAQAAFDRVWTRWARVSATGEPWAYAQRVAVTQAATWRRRRWRSVEVPVETPPAAARDDDADRAALRVVTAGWLQALPAGQRGVIVLRYLFDQSVEQTAVTLGISTGTVKSQTARALAGLRAIAEAEAEGASR